MRLSYCLVFYIGLMQACQPVANSEQPVTIFKPLVDTVSALALTDSLFNLGEHYDSINNNDSAIYFHEEALRVKKEFNTDSSLFKNYEVLGNLYRKLYKIRIADEYFEKAKSLAELNPKISSISKINLYLSLAYSKRELLNYGEARDYTRKAQQLVEKEHTNNQYLQGRVINTFGNIYTLEKQYDLAIKHYEQAILHYKRVDGFGEIGSALFNIAIIHSNLNEYEAALKYLNESLRFVRLVDGEISERVASRFLNKAGVLQDLGQYDSAEHYYRRGLTIRLSIYDEKNVNIFGARAAMAGFYLNQGQLDSSAYYFHLSLNSLVKSFNNKSIFSLPRPDHLDIAKDLAWALSEKAKVLTMIYDKNANEAYLQSSIVNLRLADSVLSVYRRYFAFEDQQFNLMQSADTDYQMGLEIPYEVGLHSALKLYERMGEEKYLEDVIYFMENSRAKILSETLARAESYNTSGSPNELIQQQNELFRKRAEVLQSIQTNHSDSLDQVLTDISKQIRLTNDRLNEVNPNYAQHEQKLPTLYELKQHAGKLDAILLEYYWSDKELFILAISREEIAFKNVNITDELANRLNYVLGSLSKQSRDFTSKNDYKQFVTNSHYLYNTLFPEFVRSSNYSRLVVSQHGPLSFLPFEVLLESMADTTEVNYKLPYILHRFTISYSQGFQFLGKPKKEQNTGTKLLAMGFSTIKPEARSGVRNGITSLPGTELEINSIKGVMNNNKNVYYLGAEASETTFKKEATKYNIIHLAVHGESDSIKALNSRLLFRSDMDSLNDGSLYAHELYSLILKNASLVVLSACESGIGKLQPGEGFLSIARGFLYAGCPSQVISLWKIDDRTSAQIMGFFYKRLSEGKEIDVSLALAKKAYLTGSNEFNTHPSLWASFLQVGEGHTILVTPSPFLSYWFLILISGLVLLSGILIWVFRRKSQQF